MRMMLQPIEAGPLHEETAGARPGVPLVVALDGALLTTRLSLECLTLELGTKGAFGILRRRLAGTEADVAAIAPSLPYRRETLFLIENARAGNRPVHLLAAPRFARLAEAVAAHLSLDGVILGDGNAAAMTEPHDFAGNGAGKGAAFLHARQSYAIATGRRAIEGLEAAGAAVLPLSARSAQLGAMIRLLRPHQYAKNALVFVPLVTAHQMNLAALWLCLQAFLAFSLAASAVYVLNDFLDMAADRAHPTKRNRPFAAGTVDPGLGLALIPLLLLGAAAAALPLPPLFGLLLAGYFGLTTAYSFWLKRMMLVDVTVLSLLYTIRVVAGAAAISVTVSEWLFAFSALLFTALALVKRYVELSARLDRDLPDPANRDYRKGDLPIIAALAAAAGMNAITVLALYVNSETVLHLYRHKALLWLLCPLFLYWISRTLLLAHRRQLHDDPIVFALKDPASWLTGALALGLVVMAM